MTCNTLYVATDLRDSRWLSYILEEFNRINQAEFAIRVCDIKAVPSQAFALYYTKEFLCDTSIPNRSSILPDGKIRYIDDKKFVLTGTTSQDRRFACPYDLFWNAFVFLSRLEEYMSEQNGKKIRSYCKNHPRKQKGSFDLPVVEHLFEELESLIKRSYPQFTFGPRLSPVIEFSHDVDYIKKTTQLRLKQTAFNAANTIRSIKDPGRFKATFRRTIHFFVSNPSYWCFDYWEKLEKRFNRRSVIYVYINTQEKDFISWLIDPSYDLGRLPRLLARIKDLAAQGFEIGLHGSYKSALNFSLLKKEKQILENVIGINIKKIRQHWLRYEEKITPYLHNDLFQYDSTLGWNDRIGFRSGCASAYRPYDHLKQQPFDYRVIPQIIMDSNIFDYGADQLKHLSQKALTILKNLKQYKTARVSVSWHQRTASKDYGWHGLYEKILENCSEYL